MLIVVVVMMMRDGGSCRLHLYPSSPELKSNTAIHSSFLLPFIYIEYEMHGRSYGLEPPAPGGVSQCWFRSAGMSHHVAGRIAIGF